MHVAPHVLGGLEDISNLLDPRYSSWSQVHIALHVLDGLEGTFNPPGLGTLFRSQVHVPLHISCTRYSSYFPRLSYISGVVGFEGA